MEEGVDVGKQRLVSSPWKGEEASVGENSCSLSTPPCFPSDADANSCRQLPHRGLCKQQKPDVGQGVGWFSRLLCTTCLHLARPNTCDSSDSISLDSHWNCWAGVGFLGLSFYFHDWKTGKLLFIKHLEFKKWQHLQCVNNNGRVSNESQFSICSHLPNGFCPADFRFIKSEWKKSSTCNNCLVIFPLRCFFFPIQEQFYELVERVNRASYKICAATIRSRCNSRVADWGSLP